MGWKGERGGASLPSPPQIHPRSAHTHTPRAIPSSTLHPKPLSHIATFSSFPHLPMKLARHPQRHAPPSPLPMDPPHPPPHPTSSSPAHPSWDSHDNPSAVAFARLNLLTPWHTHPCPRSTPSPHPYHPPPPRPNRTQPHLQLTPASLMELPRHPQRCCSCQAEFAHDRLQHFQHAAQPGSSSGALWRLCRSFHLLLSLR